MDDLSQLKPSCCFMSRRRRKVRCIQSFQNSHTCRRCEEQGATCIAQTHTSGSGASQGVSSRHRIAQLESKISSLTETVRQIQQNRQSPPTPNEQPLISRSVGGDTTTSSSSSSSSSSSHGNSSVSEQCVTGKPLHLRLLFQNDWLSVDSFLDGQGMLGHETTNTARLLIVARDSLQRLIPSRIEIHELAHAASDWLALLHSLLPLSSGPRCGEELISCYEEMHDPNVDAVRLASWLLTVAFILEQMPPDNASKESRVDEHHPQNWRSRAISDTVESKILVHDSLTGSIQALSTFILFIRLEMGRGNVHNAWVKLRHLVTIAELMGLDNISRAAHLRTTTPPVDQELCSKIQLWDIICAADRLLGMVLNLPPITTRHQQPTTRPVAVDGIVQNQVYLCRLTDISTKIYDLDHLSISNRPKAECYSIALDLSKELEVLASQVPEAWWSAEMHTSQSVFPGHIVQFLHHYVVMRVHLPLTLRQGPGDENLFNSLSCINACESMVKLYQFLGRRLPPGLFLSRMLDIQAFSAAVTLLLLSQMPSVCSAVDKVKISNEVGQVINILRERSDGSPDSGIAHHGFTTLCSLKSLFSRAADDLDLRQVAFHVPLLGKVQVRRNEHLPETDSCWSSQLLSTLGLCNVTEQFPDLDSDFHLPMGSSYDTEQAQWGAVASYTQGICHPIL
ncbi:hypothetical protein FE257_002044 [Aspergillus nanangensis]|uniref:Zn(2)-C6 fungal-type domain-containing protein n=1 Tax=Aspergillus nanangensis TaxID=2582783 RepID=A0AAD4CTN0_ASPNN|nr:hypothetical protein FE257_002044 [Aspergillus nanangensis]